MGLGWDRPVAKACLPWGLVEEVHLWFHRLCEVLMLNPRLGLGSVQTCVSRASLGKSLEEGQKDAARLEFVQN